MRLNSQSDIAIGILVACARAPAGTIRTVEAAERAKTTKNRAAQIILLLTRKGLLTTTRGRQGGIALAVPACEILLGNVLQCTQPGLFQEGASRGEQRSGTPPTFNLIVGAAEATFLAFMDRFSIADLADDGVGAGAEGAGAEREGCRLAGILQMQPERVRTSRPGRRTGGITR